MRLAAGLLAAAGAAAAWSLAVEPLWVQVRRQEIPLPGLPPGLEGLKIGFFSDLHAGMWADRDHYARAVDALARQEPDVVLLGGDVAGHRAKPNWHADLQVLDRLQAPLGRYAVLGGHDYRFDAERVVHRLEHLGWRVLRNEAVPLHEGLWLVGLDDNSRLPLRDDLDVATRDVPPGAATVVLAHSPDAVLDARPRGLGLVLSGHTHGGQVRLPFWGSLLRVTDLDNRYDQGLSRHGDTWLYVSRGVGSTWRLRFLCRPDVAVLTLVSG